jgi:hypothetical protein
MPSRFAFLNRPTRLEAWALQKLANMEIYCHARMRRESFPRRWFVLSTLSVSALAACTGFLVSQQTSFKGVNEVCKERFAIVTPKLTSFQEDYWENASNAELTPCLSMTDLVRPFFFL